MAAVVAVAGFGLLPIVISALLGCVAMVALRCLDPEEAYRAKVPAGAEDFLIKPVSSDEFIAAINRALVRSDAIRHDVEFNASKLRRYLRLTRRERETGGTSPLTTDPLAL